MADKEKTVVKTENKPAKPEKKEKKKGRIKEAWRGFKSELKKIVWPSGKQTFKNLFVVFTPFGLGVSAFIALMVCLITKKGYSWFSGYKYIRDPRGFDILPDGTHGTSGFCTPKELGSFPATTFPPKQKRANMTKKPCAALWQN